MYPVRYIKYIPVVLTVPLLPIFSFFIGFSLLSLVLWPMFSFGFFYQKADANIISPLAHASVLGDNSNNLDLTKASNWFPNKNTKAASTLIDTYYLSIPKIKIDRAVVKIGTDDLSNNLIHYGDTALPGKLGNTVIFGHSMLPVFYNPKNYLTIFTMLPKLDKKDVIYITFDGITYKYEVIGMRVLDPKDVSGLEQKYDTSYLTLVTCVPPGTYFQRLWLTARLVEYN